MGMTMQLKQLPLEELNSIGNDWTHFERIIAESLAVQAEPLKDLYLSQGISSMSELFEKSPHMRQLDEEILSNMEKILFGKEETDGGVPVVSLEKSWHAIHFLLSGEVWTGDSPLGRVLMGGDEIGDESFNTGYGNPRYHPPQSVKEISEDLPTLAELKDKYDPAKMAEAEIYGFNKDEPDEEWEYLSHFYSQMANYFQDAANRGNGMILFVT
jgi:Domain of unknown function (DUF1877)